MARNVDAIDFNTGNVTQIFSRGKRRCEAASFDVAVPINVHGWIVLTADEA